MKPKRKGKNFRKNKELNSKNKKREKENML